VPQSCAAQSKSCGVIADGCGGTLDCGSCADGASCGIVTANVCTSLSELCVPATQAVACAGKSCGVEGDGCGGTHDCGGCADGELCGLLAPFQCAAPLVSNADSCPGRVAGCAEAGAACGLIGNGCGGLFDCGGCPSGELCGVNAPYQCGAEPVCQPLAPEAACAGKCGLVSNGCGTDVAGGVIDCQALFPCPDGETCGGGGIANQCGAGGAVCRPLEQAAACGSLSCGVASDGCGGSFRCGGCEGEEVCRAGACEVPVRCVPTAQALACAGKTCGLVGDGCGGTFACGSCAEGQACGVTAPFTCGTPSGGTSCQPRTAQAACAGKECGIVFDGCGTTAEHRFDCAQVSGSGGCAAGQACGVTAPFQCDAPVQPACVPNGTSCVALGWGCGKAVNNCGQVFDCAAEGRSCAAFETCRGQGGAPTRCEGGVSDCPLCDAVPSCAASTPTRLTGRVLTPGRSNGDTANQVGVPNAFVYIPRSASADALPAIGTGLPTEGSSCDRCSEQDLGPVLASAVTDSAGNFTLSGNIPVGRAFLLVTKVGKFRRAVSQQLAPPAACSNTALPEALPANPTRLPRTTSDGLGVNIPRVAVSTGRIDAMECVFEKLGLAQSEFGHFGSTSRVHLYRGGRSAATAAGARINDDTPFDSALYTSAARLAAYDLVVADCEGDDWDGPTGFAQRIASGANVRNYVNRGGRLFASHLSFSWLHQNGTTAFSAAAPLATGLAAVGTWDTDYLDPNNLSTSGTGVVSLGRAAASSRIQNFVEWMRAEDVIEDDGLQFAVTDPRSMLTALGPDSEEFVFRSGGNQRVQQFSFDTPYGSPAAQSCGRVAYSGFHVAATGGGASPFASSVFPAHCSGALTDQEKVLLYMLFDLGACVGTPPTGPACTARACPADGSCGTFPDGCGGTIDCGCSGGQACVQNQCVTPGCVPTSCQAEGVICSSISDGCGGILDCPCPLCVPLEKARACATVACGTASDGCSGVYLCSECPVGCQPLGACPPGVDCGLISDGCDGTLDCGTCASGELCGARLANVCTVPECQPLSCAAQGASCGLVGDGCGGSADCGPCRAGQTCTTVGGRQNQCAGCQPQSCGSAGAECGLIGDGCGATADCGPCPEGQVCGAEQPNRCGSGACKPLDCARANAECGVVGDGCGATVDCGPCPSGQLCGVATPFRCGPVPTCAPRTCASASAECGLLGDGCGGLLDCGDCRAGWSCGLGAANVCRQLR
jgi:hypothetical protein